MSLRSPLMGAEEDGCDYVDSCKNFSTADNP